ncbi:hypothetical protein PUN28_000390 [Cardiocondyla obscurior]|uniref:Uncharacterized protein n=1 Tax=Cardiocondyla obscurior TaxID=286306 RepID=A0AAW2GZ75_9HYME
MSCTTHKSRKVRCVTRHEISTRSESQRSLGASLKQFHFQYSPVVIKLPDPIRKLSQQSCCTSRGGQFKADALSTWAKNQENLRSRLHSNILALGDDGLKNFQREVEAATQKKLRNEFAKEYRMFEAEKKFAVKRNADEIHAKYEEYFKLAQRELKDKLQVELANANRKCNEKLQKAIVRTRMDTTCNVLEVIRPQMNTIVTSLYDELDETCRAQKESMIADFNMIMRKQHLELDARIKEIERKRIEESCILRHELEIRNAMNIIYKFFIEKLRSNSQLKHKHYEKEIKFLGEIIAEQKESMNAVKKKIIKYSNKNKMLQEKVDALAKEFQKVLNFAFNAFPEHADFLSLLNLLSVNNTNEESEQEEN